MKIRIEDIAQPSCRMPVINTPTIYMPDRGLLAAVNYSDAKKDTNLFLIDVKKMESRKYPVPDEQYGPYGFTRGSDGKLYAGFFGGGIYSFDFETGKFTMRTKPFGDDKLIWGGGASLKGKIYMGVYPTGEFCEYDIHSGDCNVFSPMPKENLGFYAQDYFELPDGKMLVFISGAKPAILIFNPAKKQIEKICDVAMEDKNCGRFFSLLDNERVIYSAKNSIKVFNFTKAALDGEFITDIPETFSYIRRFNDSFFAVGLYLGKIYKFDKNGFSVVKENLKNGNIANGGIHHFRNNKFVCLGDNGLFTKFDTETGKEECLQIQNESSTEMKLQMFRKNPRSNTVVGSHFINSQIFSLDLNTGKSKPSLSKIVTSPGQINCATFLDNACYMGIYGRAIIYKYNPGDDFVFDVNPRPVAVTGNEQNRPVNIINDGKLVYMASKANYNALGGAITVFDPATERFDVHRDFVKTHNPTSMFYHGKGFLVGATQTFGDMKTHIPFDKNAVVFVWDMKQRKTIHTSFPWEAEALSGCALSNEGVLIGFGENKYFLFNANDFSYKVNNFEMQHPSGGIFLSSELFLGSSQNILFTLDIKKNILTELRKTKGTRLFEKISADEILIDYEEHSIKKLIIES